MIDTTDERYFQPHDEFVFVGFPNVMKFKSNEDYRTFCELVKMSKFPLSASVHANHSYRTDIFIVSPNGVTTSMIAFDKPIPKSVDYVDIIAL
jgi:hypothetical protein